jgi:hypothetical protein
MAEMRKNHEWGENNVALINSALSTAVQPTEEKNSRIS